MINLYKYFGWQGGTIHQVVNATGCNSETLIYGEYWVAEDFKEHDKYLAGLGWQKLPLKVRLALVDQMYGYSSFWFGVRDSVEE